MNDRFFDVLPDWMRTTFQVIGSILGIWFVGIPLLAFYLLLFLGSVFIIGFPVWFLWYWFFIRALQF